MTDRIEIYHRPFDPNFSRLSFTEQDRRAIAALNHQTARKFAAATPSPFPEDPDCIDPQILAWRSTAYATAELDRDNLLQIRDRPLHRITPPNLNNAPSEPLLKDRRFPCLGLALDHALERDALRRIERLDPEPGTQLRHVFYTTPSHKLLHFELAHDPPLRENLRNLPGHAIAAAPDNSIYLDWMDLETVLMNLSMHCSLGHIAHWNPTEDNPPQTRRALVTWIWNGNHSQWTRTVRLVPPTYAP